MDDASHRKTGTAQVNGGDCTVQQNWKADVHPAEEEVIAAEIAYERQGNVTHMEDQLTEAQIDEQLAQVNSKLEAYTNVHKEDYVLAITSGLFAGVIDAVFVGEISFDEEEIKLSHQQVNNFIQKFAESRGLGGEQLKDSIGALEQRFKVAQDSIWQGKIKHITPSNHHLADFAHHPTPVGLLSAIIVQFLRVGTFVNKNGEWTFICEASKEEGWKFVSEVGTKEVIVRVIQKVLIPAILTGMLNWLAAMGEKKYQENTGEEIPKVLRGIVHFAASAPWLIEIAQCADNWFGHLVSDMGGSKNTAGEGMGIPGVLMSLLYEVASLPGLKNSGLPAFVNDLYVKQKLNLRHELCLLEGFGRQSLPVIFNEVFTRVLFFANRLSLQWNEHSDIKNIDWESVMPFGNPAIDRMMTIASMTFTMADTADAAVHAAIESCGNWLLFSKVFVSRFNYVGAGRAALSIIKEVRNEQQEAQLRHEKMLLTEAKTEHVVERFTAYRNALEERVSAYLAEDMEAFLMGFDDMERGMASGDADLVIRGNVTIQRVLGREPQFTTLKEFDALMDSDDSLIL